MKVSFKSAFLLLSLLSTLVLSAQPEFITGKLINANTAEPVVYATIRVKGRALGVISNMDGDFRIPFQFKEEGEYIQISCMGYITKDLELSSLNLWELNEIELEENVFELQESVLTARKRKFSAKDIVRFAINNIKRNYPHEQFAYVGYYRDYQLKNSRYTNLNEAIIEVLDQGFNANDTATSKFLMRNYRQNLDFEIDSFAAKPYDYDERDKIVPSATLENFGANEFLLLRVHDAIRNHRINSYSYVHELPKDFIKNHIFEIDRKTYYDKRPVYQISIFRENVQFRVKGTIYIDEENYAIRKLEYSVYELNRRPSLDIEGQKPYFVTRHKIPPNTLIFKIDVEYKEDRPRGKMYLNYISFNNKFEVTRPAKFKVERTLIDLQNKRIEFTLNKVPANFKQLALRNYNMIYKGKKVPLKGVKLDPSGKIMTFEVNNSPLGKRRLIAQLFSRDFDKEKKEFSYEIKKLVDDQGNLLDFREVEVLDQFREFFVQEIVPYKLRTRNREDFLRKDMPLNHSEQPIYEDTQESIYWMNTPLKESK